MGFTCINQHICVLKLTIIGLLAINPFVLCLHTFASAQTSPELSKGQQQVLYGPDIKTSLSSVKNVLEVPLRRRFVKYHGRFYFLNVSIGSPVQSLELLLDTGSTDTWVYDNTYCDGSSSGSRFQCCKSVQRLSPSRIACFRGPRTLSRLPEVLLFVLNFTYKLLQTIQRIPPHRTSYHRHHISKPAILTLSFKECM